MGLHGTRKNGWSLFKPIAQRSVAMSSAIAALRFGFA